MEKKKCSAGRSAQAQTSCRRRGKVGNPARRSETETPGPWGTFQPGEVRDTRCADFRCRWPVVDESLRSGPMRASASTTARAARSEAERAEREAGQMRSCTPTTSAPSATGRQYRPRRRPKRARRQGQIGAGTDTPTPVQQLCTHVQSCDQSGLFFWTVHGPFSFPQDGKENGGCIAQLST